MTKEQTALDIARRMAELGERSHAVTAYTLALADARDRQPETELEAALYLFENGGNYKVAYDAFRSLYRRGFQRETLLELMTQAFYQPNIKLLKSRSGTSLGTDGRGYEPQCAQNPLDVDWFSCGRGCYYLLRDILLGKRGEN